MKNLGRTGTGFPRGVEIGDFLPSIFVGDLFDDDDVSPYQGRLFGRPITTTLPNTRTTTCGLESPKRNVVNNDEELSIEFCVPGLNKDDIDISLLGNRLSVSYKKSEENPDERYFATESFSEIFPLGSKCNLDAIESEYKDGILKITVKKYESVEENPNIKKIEVK